MAKKPGGISRTFMKEDQVIADFIEVVKKSDRSDDFKAVATMIAGQVLRHRARQNKPTNATSRP
ncbi:MAG: hypothetical protein E5V27_04605 [Mesorhizobium sp.]|nr:MAG: hypothetical protein E5V27_04605 [Mesorhizobium sp.]